MSPERSVWAIERGRRRLPGVRSATSTGASARASTGAGGARRVAGLERHAAVTIVGARRASAYGLRVAERLARELAAAGS